MCLHPMVLLSAGHLPSAARQVRLLLHYRLFRVAACTINRGALACDALRTSQGTAHSLFDWVCLGLCSSEVLNDDALVLHAQWKAVHRERR